MRTDHWIGPNINYMLELLMQDSISKTTWRKVEEPSFEEYYISLNFTIFKEMVGSGACMHDCSVYLILLIGRGLSKRKLSFKQSIKIFMIGSHNFYDNCPKKKYIKKSHRKVYSCPN